MIQKYSILFLALTAALSLTACGKKHGAHWSYEGAEGPSHWGELKQEFASCKTGSSQSPVDITGGKEGDTKIKFNYTAGSFGVIDNGHTIQANIPAGNSIELNGKKYDLLQIHFHSPSENHADGKTYPMEGHLVHKAADGELAVVGIFFTADGSDNKSLGEIFSNIPEENNKEKKAEGSLDLTGLFPADKGMFHFDGSLTTPPCSEGVKWNVFRNTVSVSDAQIKAFTKHYSSNARPVQPMNGRSVVISK